MIEIERKDHQEDKAFKLVVETTLLHPLLLRLHEVEDTQEHLHNLLALEEGKLQDMIIIGDQHLLEFQEILHNNLIMVHHDMEVVAQTLAAILMISWLCN